MTKALVSIDIITSIFEYSFEQFLNLLFELSALHLEQSSQMESVGAALSCVAAPTD